MSKSLPWDELREKALDRDGHQCRFCGVTNDQHIDDCGRGLHAHHIIPDGAGGKDALCNIIMVCRACHKVIETTQGKALRRLREEHREEIRQELKDDHRDAIKALEAEIEDLERRLNEPAETVDDADPWVVAWPNIHWLPVYVVVSSSWIGRHEILAITADKEDALELYAEHEDGKGQVSLEKRSVSVGDILAENIRVASNVDVAFDGYYSPHRYDKDGIDLRSRDDADYEVRRRIGDLCNED